MAKKHLKKLEELDQKIKDELGIDVLKYRDEEAVENFVDLLIFPKYIVSWGIRPIIFSIIAFIAGYFLIDLVHIEYFFYTIPGIVFFIVCGVLFGVLFLTWKIKSDLWGIIEYSLGIMKSSVSDLNKVGVRIKQGNKKQTMGLLFKGIMHIVTIPMVSGVISKKVPVVGGLTNAFIVKVLTMIADRIKFDEKELEEAFEAHESESKILQAYSNTISTASNGLEKILDITFGVAQLPLKIAFAIAFLVLFLFVYLLN